jgi:predicted ATPase
MITKFTVESFKSLEKVEVDLGVVNVFIGANGSGKSNLLEAIGVLSAAANGRVDDEALLRRGVRPGVPRLYKSAFPGSRKPHIFFKAQTPESFYEVALFNPVKDPKPAWRYHTELWNYGETKIMGRSHRMRQKGNPEAGMASLVAVNRKPGDPALALLDSLRNYAIYSPNTAVLRGIVQDAQLREPVGLSGGNLAAAIGTLVRRHITSKEMRHTIDEIRGMIDWAKGFGLAPSAMMPLSPSAAASKWVVRFRDRYMAEGRNVLTGYDASEGALYVLFVAVLALHDQSPDFFALDNADHGLNP